jgi:hypothetical protein
MLTPAERRVYATVGRKQMADPPTQVPVDSERAFALIGKMHFQIMDQQGMLQAASNEIRALKKFIEGLNTKIAELEFKSNNTEPLDNANVSRKIAAVV